MDTYELKAGQTIKNYKELCKILNVESTKGKGREYHIRELERHCTYHKEGQKFIIDEVYDTPKEKIDNRKNNGGHIGNTTYEELLDNIIINLLYDSIDINTDTIDMSFSELFIYNIPMLTEEYNNLYKIGYESFAKRHNMSKGLVLIYMQKLKNIMTKCLETTLNRLEKKDIILWEKNIMLVDSLLEKTIADSIENNIIKDIENKIYNEMKINHFHRTNPSINKQFKKKVCKELPDIISYYNVYSIELLDKNIQEQKENIDELTIRFVKSIHAAVSNKKSINDYGRTFYPYSSQQNQIDLEKLHKLLWELPINYKSVNIYELEELFEGYEIEDNERETENNEENIPF